MTVSPFFSSPFFSPLCLSLYIYIYLSVFSLFLSDVRVSPASRYARPSEIVNPDERERSKVRFPGSPEINIAAPKECAPRI